MIVVWYASVQILRLFARKSKAIITSGLLSRVLKLF